MRAYSITESTAWKQWVTPRRSRNKAVHRWHLFPHSFTDDLVHALVDEWKLDERDRILEPFAGAGTTLLAAKERGVPGFGYDLSPLAVLISNTKTASVSKSVLEIHWRALQRLLERMGSVGRNRRYSALVRMALPHGRLEAFDSVAAAIDKLDCTSAERDFFRLALIAILPRFSRAVANGGWLRWSTEGIDAGGVEEVFGARVEMMLSDLPDEVVEDGRVWKTGRARPAAARSRWDVHSGDHVAAVSKPTRLHAGFRRRVDVRVSRLGSESSPATPKLSLASGGTTETAASRRLRGAGRAGAKRRAFGGCANTAHAARVFSRHAPLPPRNRPGMSRGCEDRVGGRERALRRQGPSCGRVHRGARRTRGACLRGDSGRAVARKQRAADGEIWTRGVSGERGHFQKEMTCRPDKEACYVPSPRPSNTLRTAIRWSRGGRTASRRDLGVAGPQIPGGAEGRRNHGVVDRLEQTLRNSCSGRRGPSDSAALPCARRRACYAGQDLWEVGREIGIGDPAVEHVGARAAGVEDRRDRHDGLASFVLLLRRAAGQASPVGHSVGAVSNSAYRS